MKTAAIIPAAGLGTRMGKPSAESAPTSKKQFLMLADAPVLIHAVRKFARAETIDAIWTAVREEDREAVEAWLARESFSKPVRVVLGGRNRQESVKNCLDDAPDEVELVAVHDAVRPFIAPELIDRVVRQAAEDGAVILGMPALDTVKQVDQRVVRATLPRERIMLAQTPQVFRAELLRRAYARAEEENFVGTDESSLVEHLGEDVHVMMGSARNIKITRPEDWDLALYYYEQEKSAAGVS